MTMTKAALVGLRDTLEHLTECQKQLEWTEDAGNTQVLIDVMLRDLDRCRRLIEAYRLREGIRHAG